MDGNVLVKKMDYKKLIPFVPLMLFLIGLSGCSSDDQVYEGVYQGLKMSTESREYGNDEVLSGEEELPDYQQYKKDREKILQKDGEKK